MMNRTDRTAAAHITGRMIGRQIGKLATEGVVVQAPDGGGPITVPAALAVEMAPEYRNLFTRRPKRTAHRKNAQVRRKQAKASRKRNR